MSKSLRTKCIHVSVLTAFNVNAVLPEAVLLKYFKYHRRSPVEKSIQTVTEFTTEVYLTPKKYFLIGLLKCAPFT